MRSRPRDGTDDDADVDDNDSDRALAPVAVGESGGDAVALHWPQNRPVGRLSLKLPFGDRRFDGWETSMLAIGPRRAKLDKSCVRLKLCQPVKTTAPVQDTVSTGGHVFIGGEGRKGDREGNVECTASAVFYGGQWGKFQGSFLSLSQQTDPSNGPV
jgi:hypothetical protein